MKNTTYSPNNVTVPKNKSYALAVADRIKKLQKCRLAYEMDQRGYSKVEIATHFDISVTRVKQLITSHERRISRETEQRFRL